MAMRRIRRRKKPKYYEYSPTWDYVHETFKPADACEPGEFRSTKARGVQTVICCPTGTKMDMKARCCKRTGKSTCDSKPEVQSVRVPKRKFARRHPGIWKKLRDGTIDEKTGTVIVKV